MSIYTLSHSKASSIHHPAMPMNSSHLPRALAKTSYSILSPISALSTKHAVCEHKSSFSYCQIARTYKFRPYREPWYSSRLPYLAYQSEEIALAQFIAEFHPAVCLLKLPWMHRTSPPPSPPPTAQQRCPRTIHGQKVHIHGANPPSSSHRYQNRSSSPT